MIFWSSIRRKPAKVVFVLVSKMCSDFSNSDNYNPNFHSRKGRYKSTASFLSIHNVPFVPSHLAQGRKPCQQSVLLAAWLWPFHSAWRSPRIRHLCGIFWSQHKIDEGVGSLRLPTVFGIAKLSVQIAPPSLGDIGDGRIFRHHISGIA